MGIKWVHWIFIYMGIYDYTSDLELVVSYAKSLGFDVYFNHDDISYIDWRGGSLNEPSEIYIESGFTQEEVVYLLLHELGHHELRKDWETYRKVLPISAHAEYMYLREKVGKYKRRVSYKVSSMEEEFKAWEEGYWLGVELGVRIDDEKWNIFRVKFLWEYMCHFVGKK